MMAEMAKRSGQKGVPAAPKRPEVQLVVNPRKNSILAKAPPDQMVIIEQAVKSIDVPSDRFDSLIANPGRMQIYRLHGIDPEPIAKTLEEIGELDPTTRLEVDERNNAIIAFASLADHVIIRQLVERLDGSGRKFEVVQLRRLAADYVAGTIEFMMGSKEEESGRSRYDYFSYRYGRRDESEDKDQFKVDADVESNRLLLWANEIEIAEVMNLLVKLGELPPEGGGQSTLRVLDAVPADEAEALLERLRRVWPSLAPNDLQLPTLPEEEGQEDSQEPSADPSAEAQDAHHRNASPVFPAALIQAPADVSPIPPEKPASENAPGNNQDDRSTGPSPDLRPALPPENVPKKATPRPQQAAPPVNLSFGADGSIIITSQDPAALDLLEEAIHQLAPPRREYEIFRLQYADAYWVKDNLEEYFEEDDSDSFRGPFFFGYREPESESRFRLSSRRKLKFIYDLDTNSILVQGADAKQLQTIKELIEIYDQPEPTESQTARVSALFQIKYSKASVIAEAIKDVYRDLLSSNDKALGQNPEQKNRSAGSISYLFGMGGGDAPERTKATFKGKLSMGVDDVTNTLLVSAEGENLMENISRMIETLDEAAKPVSTVSVVQLNGGVNAAHVQEVLTRVLAEQAGKSAQEGGQGQKPPEAPAGQGRSRSSSTTRVLSVAPR
jgi:type II secretory pathway component GspD/PulD (secretin)